MQILVLRLQSFIKWIAKGWSFFLPFFINEIRLFIVWAMDGFQNEWGVNEVQGAGFLKAAFFLNFFWGRLDVLMDNGLSRKKNYMVY